MKKILIAVPKGRILQELDKIFKVLSLLPEQDFYNENSRKIIFNADLKISEKQNIAVELIKVRSFDVANFVRFGAADLGICGADVLLEFKNPDILSLLDLNIGKCHLAIASLKYNNLANCINNIRVATKYPNIANEYLSKIGIQPQIIKLNGAIEIACKLNLADFIIDLVSTGNSLKENNLTQIEKVCDISSILIANRQSFKINNIIINEILNKLVNVL